MGNKQGIYQIKNTVNGKIYIGSTASTRRRFREHKRYLRGNYHRNPHLQSSWNKHGEDAFEFSVVYEVDTVDELLPHEQWCLDVMLPEYNIAIFADSSFRGMKHSEEAKMKLRKAHLGKKHTEETKAKISQASMGYAFSKLTRAEVVQIRKLYKKKDNKKKNKKQYSQCQLADMFGVPQPNISGIVTGKSRKYLGEEWV